MCPLALIHPGDITKLYIWLEMKQSPLFGEYNKLSDGMREVLQKQPFKHAMKIAMEVDIRPWEPAPQSVIVEKMTSKGRVSLNASVLWDKGHPVADPELVQKVFKNVVLVGQQPDYSYDRAADERILEEADANAQRARAGGDGSAPAAAAYAPAHEIQHAGYFWADDTTETVLPFPAPSTTVAELIESLELEEGIDVKVYVMANTSAVVRPIPVVFSPDHVMSNPLNGWNVPIAEVLDGTADWIRHDAPQFQLHQLFLMFRDETMQAAAEPIDLDQFDDAEWADVLSALCHPLDVTPEQLLARRMELLEIELGRQLIETEPEQSDEEVAAQMRQALQFARSDTFGNHDYHDYTPDPTATAFGDPIDPPQVREPPPQSDSATTATTTTHTTTTHTN